MDHCTKTGEPVIDVLQSKHPETSEPLLLVLKKFPKLPAFQDVNVTAEVIETVAPRMSGAAGPDGVDTTTIQDWILQYGQNSKMLRESLA
eukprot:1397729-Ditylum_brightwellii.AAC.1